MKEHTREAAEGWVVAMALTVATFAIAIVIAQLAQACVPDLPTKATEQEP